MQLPKQIFVGQALVKIDCPSLLRTPEDSLNMDQLYFNIIYLLYVLKYIHSGCDCGLENSKEGVPKIVGGSDVTENQYPWYAAIWLYEIENGIETFGRSCGGSLITDRVVASAGHCALKEHNDEAKWRYRIGLGLHNISGYRTWSEEELEKHDFQDVQDIITDFNYTIISDFALFILKNPVKFSKTVSPLCLPMKEELERIESEENILVGFGASQIWYLGYDKLLGGKLETTSLIPIEMFANSSAIMDDFRTDNYEEEILQRYFKTFAEIFPGIDSCIKNYKFVCKITDEMLDNIVANIKSKIEKSGTKNDDQDVQAFLG